VSLIMIRDFDSFRWGFAAACFIFSILHFIAAALKAVFFGDDD
jgi:hypothetical protein